MIKNKIIGLLLLILISCGGPNADYREGDPCTFKYKVGDIVCILGLKVKITNRGFLCSGPEYRVIYIDKNGNIEKRIVEESLLEHCK